MVSFGGNSKKKATATTTTTEASPTKPSAPASSKATSPKSGTSNGLNNIFRKVITPQKTSTISPSTPTTAPSTPISPDPSIKIIKERPNVDTIEVPISASSQPSNKIETHLASKAENASLLDNPDIYRIDSVLSDLSGSIAATGPPPQSSSKNTSNNDPPALVLRTHSIEAGSGSSGYISPNVPTVSNTTTTSSSSATPKIAPSTSITTTESIVTKVLGIVDLSCVSTGLVPATTTSPFGNKKTIGDDTALKPTYSFQPEWGVAPEDEETTLVSRADIVGTSVVSSPNVGNDSSPTNGSSTIKRDLAEIAARASGPSTLQYDSNLESSRQYRRYHETFELVYTEPKGKKKTSKKGALQKGLSTSNGNGHSNATNDKSLLTMQNKSLRINRWVASKWKAKKQMLNSSADLVSPVIDIVTQQQPQQQLYHRTLDIDTSSKTFVSRELNNVPSSVMAENTTEATATTNFATPTSDISSNRNQSGSVYENIETTNSPSKMDMVLVTTTNAVEGTSESLHVSIADETKNSSGGNKSWYRFTKPTNNSSKNKKEKRTTGADNLVAALPKIGNQTSPTKKKGYKNKSLAVAADQSYDINELQPNPTKIILKSIKGSNMGLETVAEEDYTEDNTELKVRVPGFHNEDSYLSDHDLIGSEIVEEIYTSLEKSIEENDEANETSNAESPLDQKDETENEPKLSAHDVTEDIPTKSNDSVLIPPAPLKVTAGGYQEIRDVGSKNVKPAVSAMPPQRLKTWKERFRLKKAEADSKVETTTSTISEHGSTRAVLDTSDKEISTPQLNRPKPVWKAAVDPATGNTYYYHKKTRETTWTKPPDWDLVPPKEHPKETHAAPIAVEDADEIDKAMKTNAIPTSTEEVVIVENEPEGLGQLSDVDNADDSRVNEASQEEYDEVKSVTQPASLHDSSRPFDEPMAELDYPDDEKTKGDTKSMTTARTRTTTSIYSGFSSRFSTKSRRSEVTQPIMNLSSNKPKFDASHASNSTKNEELPTVSETILRQRRQPKIPKNIPVPRLRELNVEEFTTRDREYNGRNLRVAKSPRNGAENGSARPVYSMSNTLTPDVGETEDADADKSTVSYAATDSISALSEADLSFVDRKEAYDDARRRALDRAIAQEDWDLAAKLSESMRKTIKTSNNASQAVPREWVQSEMDRFISENDWDAVASYIAQVRANANEISQKRMESHLGAIPATHPHRIRATDGILRNVQSTSSDVSGTSNPQKRFGARSQLQHRDIDSVDSHSSYSTTFDSEYTSESYEQRSEDDRPSGPRKRQQEFAC